MRHAVTIQPDSYTTGHLSQKKAMLTQKSVINVHSSFIWNSQKLETTQMSLKGMSLPWNTRQQSKGTTMHPTTWMYLQSIMLSEQTQSQMVIYCMIPFTQRSWNDKIRDDALISGCQGLGLVTAEGRCGLEGDPCGHGTAQYLGCSGGYTSLHIRWYKTTHPAVRVLVLKLHYNYVRCNHWGRLGERYLYLFNFLWICNFKIKVRGKKNNSSKCNLVSWIGSCNRKRVLLKT